MNLADNNYWEFFKTGIMPVLIFFLGFGLNSLLTYCKEQKRLSDVKEYFLTLVDLECQAAYTQAAEYKKNSEELKKVGNRNTMVNTVVGAPTESIKAINKQDLFKNFIKGKNISNKSRDFNTVLASINVINASIESVDEKYVSFATTATKYIEKFDADRNSCNRIIEKIMGTTDLTVALKNPDPFINELAKILDDYNYTGTSETPYTYYYENYILKLKQYINIPKKRADPRSSELFVELKRLEAAYLGLKEQYDDRHKNIEIYANNLTLSANRIKQIMERLD